MQIVINIPNSLYANLKTIKHGSIASSRILECVKNGTPLPKSHGRLIDADKLLNSNGIIADSRKCHYIPMLDVYDAPTIIEADKEGKER